MGAKKTVNRFLARLAWGSRLIWWGVGIMIDPLMGRFGPGALYAWPISRVVIRLAAGGQRAGGAGCSMAGAPQTAFCGKLRRCEIEDRDQSF
jgi:hypothetical protein